MQNHGFNSFSLRMCLTQEGAKERQKQASAEFARVGVVVDFFYAYPGETPFMSFCESQWRMIEYGVRHNNPNALLFEDDVLIKDTAHLGDALEELPPYWDMVYFGANITEDKPEKFSKHLCRLRSAWTTHAVAYNADVMKFIYKNYKYGSGAMYDDWLSKEVLPRFNCFIVNPMICWQRPGKSALWDRETDYTPCFEGGNLKMI